MKKGLLIAVAATVLFAANAEAGSRNHRVNHPHGMNSQRVVTHKAQPRRTVVVHRPAPVQSVYTYSYVAQPVYVAAQPAVYYPASSIFFSNRNFSFALSNLFW